MINILAKWFMSFDLDDIFNISKEEPNGLFLYKQFTIANGLSVLWKNNPYIK